MLALGTRAPNSLIQLLLQSGADPHLSDGGGRTVLHWAVREWNVWAIKWLIAENVDVFTPVGDPGDRKPVFQFLFDSCHSAMVWGHTDLTHCLEYLRGMQAVALAGAKLVANASFVKRTHAQLTEELHWFIPRSVELSNSPICQRYELTGEDLREIRDIVHVLIDMLSNPSSLRHLCRVQIRRLLGRDFRRKLYQLDIPLTLQEYLMVYKEVVIAL